MGYTVKLKNKVGTEVNYSSIEQVNLPLASGGGNATFMARYNVTKYASANISYVGGDSATNSTDYVCLLSTASTGKHVPDGIKLKIGNSEVVEGVTYVYTKLSDTEAIVKINGSYITGDIEIEAVAVTPSV